MSKIKVICNFSAASRFIEDLLERLDVLGNYAKHTERASMRINQPNRFFTQSSRTIRFTIIFLLIAGIFDVYFIDYLNDIPLIVGIYMEYYKINYR